MRYWLILKNSWRSITTLLLPTEREPLRDHLLDMIDGDQPSVLQRKSIGDRLLKKVVNFVETFVEGVGR